MSATVVWKFPIPYGRDIVEVLMPRGAEVLYVADQTGTPCMWARVDPDNEEVSRLFRFSGTGHYLDDEVGAHIGSWQQGSFVWHLFALGQP